MYWTEGLQQIAVEKMKLLTPMTFKPFIFLSEHILITPTLLVRFGNIVVSRSKYTYRSFVWVTGSGSKWLKEKS